MEREHRDRLVVYRFESLPSGVEALVSTRHGGVSAPPYESLNVGLGVGDESGDVVENRRRLLAALGLDLERSVWCRQVHSGEVVVAGPGDAGRGSTGAERGIAEADALVTDTPGLALCVTVADCVPVVLFDPERRVAGLAHAGWRGTVARICSRTVATMGERFGSEPAALIAAIGPSIGPAGYEVGAEVASAARAAYGGRAGELLRPGGASHSRFDLWSANRIDLEAAGLDPARIELGAVASDERLDDFFSHRREGGHTGRFAAAIRLT